MKTWNGKPGQEQTGKLNVGLQVGMSNLEDTSLSFSKLRLVIVEHKANSRDEGVRVSR